MSRVLVIDDDRALQETLRLALEAEGFQVLSETDGEKALERATQESLDLIILDFVLPHLTGMEILRRLRDKGNATPVIMLTGQKKEEVDKVLGLELGADDYMLKPFGTKEFMARVHAVLRRSRPGPVTLDDYAFDDVEIHFKKRTASRGREELHLTAKEYGLLHLLISHEGDVVSRETILNEVWGYDKFPSTRTVDTFMHNLRQKVEADPGHPRHLLTVAWSGYKFQK
jgi:DNA-binding response OmpR family regulator